MSNSKQIIYALECGHAAPGAPTLVSGVLVCAWCRLPIKIVGVIEYEWRAKCNGCRYTRWAGMSRHNAAIMAAGHVRRNPTHDVTVEYLRDPEATETARKMQAWKGKETA
jgi:hypothetical protein